MVVAQRRVGGLHALDVSRQRLRIVSRGGQDAHGELVGLQFVLALEREESRGHRVALPRDGVPAPTAHHDERYRGLIGDLSARHLARLLAGGDVRDGVGQHAGEFVFIGGGQNQAGRNEDGPARKRGGLVNPGLIVVRQFEGVRKARRRATVPPGAARVRSGRRSPKGRRTHVLPAILRGELRAERLFLFDRHLRKQRPANPKNSEPPHTFIVRQASRPVSASLPTLYSP